MTGPKHERDYVMKKLILATAALAALATGASAEVLNSNGDQKYDAASTILQQGVDFTPTASIGGAPVAATPAPDYVLNSDGERKYDAASNGMLWRVMNGLDFTPTASIGSGDAPAIQGGYVLNSDGERKYSTY